MKSMFAVVGFIFVVLEILTVFDPSRWVRHARFKVWAEWFYITWLCCAIFVFKAAWPAIVITGAALIHYTVKYLEHKKGHPTDTKSVALVILLSPVISRIDATLSIGLLLFIILCYTPW